MRLHNFQDFKDFSSVIALNKDYVTAEPYVEGGKCYIKLKFITEYDLRIQKIGHRYRAYKRMSMADNWKTNVGNEG